MMFLYSVHSTFHSSSTFLLIHLCATCLFAGLIVTAGGSLSLAVDLRRGRGLA